MKVQILILLTFNFLSGCCLGGPDISYHCDRKDNSILIFDNTVTYDKETQPNIQLNDPTQGTSFIAYTKGNQKVSMNLFFNQSRNNELTLDTEKSEILYLNDQAIRNSYKFIRQSTEIQEFETDNCCQKNGCTESAPDNFKATISGQVQSENQIKDIDIVIDIVTTEFEHREC